ncbi:VOC family protein [Paludibaculum fermentans]|uniref:VOC family protein n=1 Tax=Paludibaculum fermentans TaxID=1473598 RepID=UPI003EB9B1DC
MIQRLSHVTIYVLDQDEAYDFYINKLGFEVRMDAKMDNGFRWLTVSPKGQPDLQIILMPTTPTPMMDKETSDTLRSLVKKGVLSAGVFKTANCQQTYEELKAKGVEFVQPPTERFYGIEALVKDNSGNWFSMTQPKEAYEVPSK